MRRSARSSGSSSRRSAAAQIDVARQLNSLELLRTSGVITPEEFETFKRRVLDASGG